MTRASTVAVYVAVLVSVAAAGCDGDDTSAQPSSSGSGGSTVSSSTTGGGGAGPVGGAGGMGGTSSCLDQPQAFAVAQTYGSIYDQVGDGERAWFVYAASGSPTKVAVVGPDFGLGTAGSELSETATAARIAVIGGSPRLVWVDAGELFTVGLDQSGAAVGAPAPIALPTGTIGDLAIAGSPTEGAVTLSLDGVFYLIRLGADGTPLDSPQPLPFANVTDVVPAYSGEQLGLLFASGDAGSYSLASSVDLAEPVVLADETSNHVAEELFAATPTGFVTVVWTPDDFGGSQANLTWIGPDGSVGEQQTVPIVGFGWLSLATHGERMVIGATVDGSGDQKALEYCLGGAAGPGDFSCEKVNPMHVNHDWFDPTFARTEAGWAMGFLFANGGSGSPHYYPICDLDTDAGR